MSRSILRCESVLRAIAARLCASSLITTEYWLPRPRILTVTADPIFLANCITTAVYDTTITQCHGDSKERMAFLWTSSRDAACGPTVETRCRTGYSPG